MPNYLNIRCINMKCNVQCSIAYYTNFAHSSFALFPHPMGNYLQNN